MGQSNASNGAKDIDAFNEGELEGVNTHDNIKFGDWSKEARQNYLKLKEQMEKERKNKKNKK